MFERKGPPVLKPSQQSNSQLSAPAPPNKETHPGGTWGAGTAEGIKIHNTCAITYLIPAPWGGPARWEHRGGGGARRRPLRTYLISQPAGAGEAGSGAKGFGCPLPATLVRESPERYLLTAKQDITKTNSKAKATQIEVTEVVYVYLPFLFFT